MTPDEYRRLTLAQMKSRAWRTTREIANGNMVIPAGTPVQITDKRGGLALTGAPCTCCGVQVRVHGVAAFEVEEVTAP
jgi:hypothetical protein